MSKQTHYIVRIKERGRNHFIETEYIGNKTKREIIEFYGLENDDVAEYTIQIAGTPLMYGHRKATKGSTQERATLRQESRETAKANNF